MVGVDPNDGKIDRMSLEGCRPDDLANTARYPLIADPEGDAQDVHRFSMRQGCFIEKSPPRLSRQFRSGLECFLDSRFQRSPFGPASPFAPQAAQW